MDPRTPWRCLLIQLLYVCRYDTPASPTPQSTALHTPVKSAPQMFSFDDQDIKDQLRHTQPHTASSDD